MSETASDLTEPLVDEGVERLSRVALVGRALTAGLDASDVIDIVVRQGMAGLDAEGGVLALVDQHKIVTPVVSIGYPKETVTAFGPLRLDRDLPLTTAARENIAVWVSSRAEARSRFPALLAGPTQSQAWAAIPLVTRDSVFGVLGVSFLGPHEFSEGERLFLCMLADLTALVLANRLPASDVGSNAIDTDEPAIDRSAAVPAALDVALNLVFRTSLTVSGVAAYKHSEPEVARRLHTAIDDLDTAVQAIQNASVMLSVSQPT